MLHLTLSLPAGLHATNEQWLMIVDFVMKRLGLRVNATPWVAARHVDASCDHIHVAIALCDFLGNPLRFRGQQPHTEATSQDLARHLGLEVLQYFVPTIPRLSPITPARNLDKPAHKRLHAALEECFVQHQPETITELDALLGAPPHSYRREESLNSHGVISNIWHGPDGAAIRGGALGNAWEPRHVQERLQFAAALRLLRQEIDARQCLQALAFNPDELKETLDEIRRTREDARIARAAEGFAGRDRAPGEGGAAPAPAARPAPETRGTGTAAIGNPEGTGYRDGRHRRPVGAGEKTEQPYRSEVGSDHDWGDQGGGILIRAMMRARELARQLGMRMRIKILWASHALSLRFADTSALLLSQRGTMLPVPTTPDSDAFLFAREHAQKRGWVDLSGRDDWPVPAPGERGDWLTAPAPVLTRLRAQILRKPAIEQLPGSPFSRGELDATLEQFYPHADFEHDPPQPRLAVPSQRVFLIVTKFCSAKDVPHLKEQISWLKARRLQAPIVQAIFLNVETGTLQAISFERLENKLLEMLTRKKGKTANSLPSAPQSITPGPAAVVEEADLAPPSHADPDDDDFDLRP